MPTLLMAQPADPTDLCPNPRDPECPIDSGTILLIVAVISIAAMKAYKFLHVSKKSLV